MNYPLISEYIEAVKNAEDNFDALSHLRPVLDANGEPVMTSGNFAVVFKMEDKQTGRYYAIKCFLKEQEGRAEAYRLISEELEYVSSTFLTPIKYLDKELFVDSQSSSDTEFPVLQMDWVEGETLDKYVRNHIDDQYELAKLAYQFSRLAMWLMPQPFAHGDLKPDNILVRQDGMLVLVDYDGMFVPAMQGQKARELGSPDFRHPARTEDDFNEHIDDFSIVSILLSLRVISLHPDLLLKYGASDRLLLSEKDYRDISQCALLKELYPSTDSELNILISLFTLALEKKNLSSVSFRLLDLARPKEVAKPVITEPVNTEVTEEDLADAWEDKYGVKYSKDRTRLLKGDSTLDSYTILAGTKVICDKAFSNVDVFSYYNKSLKEITIPNSVTSIGDYAFFCCRSLKEINIPKSVTSIGEWAFLKCESLKEITIPNSVTSIGKLAFAGCKSLKEIIIPNSVTNIGGNPFLGCRDLKSIICLSKHFVLCDDVLYSADMTTIIAYIGRANSFIIPNSVTSIGDYAFAGCESLKEINIPNSITSIGNEAFSYCKSIEKITIPNSVTSIGKSAFSSCVSLKEITIPNSVTSIGDKAFYHCHSLIEINIPNSVTSIGNSAFRDCNSIEKINIPNSVTSIGDEAFCGCESLKEINIPLGTREKFEKMLPDYKDLFVEVVKSIVPEHVNTKATNEDLADAWEDEYGVKYSKDRIRLLKGNNSLSSYTILQGTKVICDNAFSNCCSLKEITIPDSVTSIGYEAFFNCESLEEIIIPDSVTSIGNGAFRECDSLEEITIPDSVTSIGDEAFHYCHSLKEITIPNSVTSIGDEAFASCHSLKEIIIPDSVTSIGEDAFHWCISLEKIIIPYGTRAKFEKMLRDKLIFLNRELCEKLVEL